MFIWSRGSRRRDRTSGRADVSVQHRQRWSDAPEETKPAEIHFLSRTIVSTNR
ncbi:Hypothetical protein SMAX5B_002513 [Scophthalmus maximus]|uniref:Uncharacterized protein n=1 Tax=Scophthalmus maximus TaxID=52904 RepID=A0A2U9BAS9_SCOMX|nr:Hypothetical protein SMAX5B_002513 [Scophthalmus maximus]